MPRRSVPLCLSLLAVLGATPRHAPAQPVQSMQEVFDTLRSNVGGITPPAEKDRWNANVALWKLLLDQDGVVAEMDTVAARARLDAMKANAGGITLPEEKERWQANVDLWQVRLARPGTLPRSDVDRVTALLYRMNANIGRITRPDEKTRWRANYELWKMLLATP